MELYEPSVSWQSIQFGWVALPCPTPRILKFYHLRPNKIGHNADLTYKFGRVKHNNSINTIVISISNSISIISSLKTDGKKCMVLCYGK